MEQKTLKQLRIENRYTIKQVSELSGVKHGTYVGYEYNNRKVSLENAQKLAAFYGLEIKDIKFN